jgi:2-phosphosulfolactate phosphatase
MMFYDQSRYTIRCEWGLRGLEALAPLSDVLIIVDVLSFSTCVDVATARGAVIFPYPWRDNAAEAYAKSKNALLASRTRRFAADGYSLAPSSLLHIPSGTRLVLPSPNGSTLTRTAATYARTLTGGLRNAEAVARYAQTQGEVVTVIACGERWEQGHALRPALEDLLGAGAIIAGLSGAKSPEARAAVAVFNDARDDLEPLVKACSSGRELMERGFEEDVDLAVRLNTSSGVPVLVDDAYVCQHQTT